nr:immunoglobulin heavy chain junction region [Macaca mulatta]MOW19845.1 immunoglobulin heavy chain junction region [Macaca mulatta]MOW20618.1 immunoglobulin heavy chain junction region [Macaca mulatta]MOW21063.1 immunoglobulin heavy chain junction region [Macaca mulatta]MOW21651.1 immunoglobulin heavy chain junction region [Macaca mulatta]
CTRGALMGYYDSDYYSEDSLDAW